MVISYNCLALRGSKPYDRGYFYFSIKEYIFRINMLNSLWSMVKEVKRNKSLL